MIGDEVSHFYLRLLHVVKRRLRFVSSVCEKKILGISNTLKTMPDPESFSNTAGGAPKSGRRKPTKSKSTKSKSTKSKSKSKKSKSSKK